ncbi:MAG: hypothetical protein V4505_25520 [Pseudomonadota bacterium]
MQLVETRRWRIFNEMTGGWHVTRWSTTEPEIRECYPEATPAEPATIARRLETDFERAHFLDSTPSISGAIEASVDRWRAANPLPEPTAVRPPPPPPTRTHEEVMEAIRLAHPDPEDRTFEARCRVSILLREHGPSRFTADQVVAAEWHVRELLEATLKGPVRLFNAVRCSETARDHAISHLKLVERPLLLEFVGAYRKATVAGRALLGGGMDFWFQVQTAPPLYSFRAAAREPTHEATPSPAPAPPRQSALF